MPSLGEGVSGPASGGVGLFQKEHLRPARRLSGAPSFPFKVFAPPPINLTGAPMSEAKAAHKSVPKTVPTWGYHATEPARIFDIREDRKSVV